MRKTKSVIVDGLEIELRFKKMKNVYLRVKADGRILLSAPIGTSTRYLKDFVRQRRDWIEKSRQKIDQRTIPTLGEAETLVFGQVITKKLSDGQLQALLEDKVNIYYRKYWPYFDMRDCPEIEFKYRKMTSTWGVCRPASKTITLNKRLVHKPEAFVEYVVLHELCHLLICNHSREFYRLLAELMPEYKEKMKVRLIHS